MEEKRYAIEKIVSIEWDMFISVNEGEARASCQEDRTTFDGMRTAQYNAWSTSAVESYLNDLVTATQSGRNLIEEKYIHMMRTTEPSKYSMLLSRFPAPTDTVTALAREISNKLLEQTRSLFEEYPYISGRGRPLYSAMDCGDISVETYQLGELLTLSEQTLCALNEHIITLEKDSTSLARAILKNTVGFYGYTSLDAAEQATKEKAAKEQAGQLEIEVSFGCQCDS